MAIQKALRIDPLSVAQIFQSVKPFSVPSYQRGYAWGDEQVLQLLEDLRDALSENPQDAYILGQIITCNSPENIEIEIVDGQQRITTLYILLAVLWNRIQRDLSFESITMQQKVRFHAVSQMLVVGDDADGKLVPKLEAAKDGAEYVKRILNNERFPAKEESLSQQNIRDAAEKVSEFLKKEFDELDEVLSFLFFILDNVHLLQLSLDSPKQALHVFAKMNNRGLTLDDADLLKNLLFIMVKDDQEFGKLSDDWDTASKELFQARLKRVRSMEFLMKALIGIETGDSVPTSKVFERWEERLDDASKAQDFASELPQRAKNLATITHGKTPQHSSQTRETAGVQMFNWVQHLEVLLAGDGLSESAYKELARIVEARVMLSMYAQEKNQKFESMVHKWSSAVRKLAPNASRNDILEASSFATSNLDELLSLAKVGIQNLSYATASHRPKIRYVLARCAYAVQLATREDGDAAQLADFLVTPTKTNPAGYAIDHVFPQSEVKAPFWLGDSLESIQRIGNLVLLHSTDNQSLGDTLPWEIDKLNGYQNSKLIVNRILVKGPDTSSFTNRVKQFVEKLDNGFLPTLDGWSEESSDGRFNFYWHVFSSDLKNVLLNSEN